MTGGNDNHIADKHRSPNVMFRSLLMMAAIISVPPVLPLAEKATPMPPPQKDAPMTHANKGLVVERSPKPAVNF